MPSHCHFTVFAYPLLTVASIEPYHPLSLNHDDTIFNVDRSSYSFIDTNVDISALSQVPSLLPYQRYKHHQYNNHQLTLTYQHRPQTPPLLHHLQRSPSCLPSRPTILLRRSHLRSNPNLRRPRACFIFVVVGLCRLIVWVGEGACARC